MAGERQERGKGFSTSPTIIRDRRLRAGESCRSLQRGAFRSRWFPSCHQQIPRGTCGVLGATCPIGEAPCTWSQPHNTQKHAGKAGLEVSSPGFPLLALSILAAFPSCSHPRRRLRASHMECRELCHSRKPLHSPGLQNNRAAAPSHGEGLRERR